MGSAEKRTLATEAEYFAYDSSIEGWAEYYSGEVFDMAGGSERHNRICMNLARFVGNRLDGKPCRTYNGDFRLAIERANSFVRPDFWVICGKTDLYPGRDDTARNATLIIEVQSDSTTTFDRRGKWLRYQMLESIREYVLIEQDSAQVDIFFKTNEGTWEFQSITDMNANVPFRSVGIELPMREIYKDLEFADDAMA
ncbi:MAG: Uma2 family endonuclease [Bacteroidia bacterium]